MAKPHSDYFKATDSFTVAQKGTFNRVIREGEVVAADDTILRTHRHLFTPLGEERLAGVERATAAPGESRNVGTQAGHEALTGAKGE